MIIVSTDGSCLRNPGGAIGWAWVDHAGGAESGGAATGTNQIAELRAVLEAIRSHPGSDPLLIESDSLYAIKCASEWLHNWRNNGWRTSTGGAVKNVELIRNIDHAIAARPGPVRFRWVRGHVGNYFNEQADALAGAAARKAAATAPRDNRPATGARPSISEKTTISTATGDPSGPRPVLETSAAAGKAAEPAAGPAADYATTAQALHLF